MHALGMQKIMGMTFAYEGQLLIQLVEEVLYEKIKPLSSDNAEVIKNVELFIIFISTKLLQKKINISLRPTDSF
jgi:hypothetical protein